MILVFVNGFSYPVPVETALDDLEQHLDFSLSIGDVIMFPTPEGIWNQFFYPWPSKLISKKETYISPFTEKEL